MELNIKNFLYSTDTILEFKGNLSNNDTFYDLNGLNIEFPISYSGKVLKISGDLLLDLSVEYKYTTQCDRCLNPIEKKMTNVNKYFLSEKTSYLEEETDFEYVLIKGQNIPLSDLIFSQIIISMPSKNLCKIDCKGLCPMCGVNLNESVCSCNKIEEIDDRFKKLSNLFKNEEV